VSAYLECLSAHVVAEEYPAPSSLLPEIRDTLAHRFSIHHVTIQIEPEGMPESHVCD